MCELKQSGRLILAVAIALITLSTDAVLSQGQSSARGRRTVILDGREVVEGEVIVRYAAQADAIQREQAEFYAYSDTAETIGRTGSRRLRSRTLTTRQMLATLRANPDVAYAEPNYIIRALAMPNDPSFGAQWALLNTGQVVDGQSGVPGADIGAVAAWDRSTGSRTHIVAVLDSGIDYTHPDLAANVFTAPRAFSVTMGTNTITCVAGTHGFDALNNTCGPIDTNGHGTHVAGIIGAVGNNNTGVTGVNWTANIMALKVLGADGTGTTADAIKAINWAIKAKAALGADGNIRVLNASWGGPVFSQALNDEIAAANNADILFVAAAGTDGTNNDAVPHYPASSTHANVVSVGASDNRGRLAPYSNYGATSVDLAAPGAATLSTLPNNAYGELSGTSMSAAFVSGAAALVLSYCPSNTAILKSRLLAGVDLDSTMSGKTVSGGSLDVDRVLDRCDVSLHATINGSTITATVENGFSTTTDWLALYCPATNGDNTYIDWRYLNGQQTPPSAPLNNATVMMQAPSQSGVACNVRLFTANTYDKLATSETVTTGSTSGPTLTIADVSVTEGNSGTTTATFTVTLSPVNASQTVTVNYATANGSATAGADYAAASGTLTFTPSTATRTISVTINGDTTVEPSETFVVNLSGAVNATIGDAQATGIITTDDAPPGPAVSVSSTTVAPGATINFTVSGGPGNATDWVSLSAASAMDNNFLDWMYLNGQKTAPGSGVSGATLQFTAPATPGTYNIRFYAANSYTKLATSPTITVGAGGSALTIGDGSIAEGNSGTATATFTVTLSPVNASQTVTVNYATANGSATAGSDYVAASGTLTFPPSTATQTISVTINGDTAVESSETFVINLSGATNASISDAQATGTITNDDAAAGPAVNVSSTTVAPGATINFTVSGGPGNPTDWVSLSAASAMDNNFLDWIYLNGQKTAPASGLTGATLQFTAPATPGTYNIRFYAANSYTKLATSPTITVGAGGSALTIGDGSIAEGNSGTATATFTVTLSPVNASQTVTVNYATANGSATAGSDYVAASGTLTFPPSTATQTISVTINGDTAVESSETFVINLSGATNASIGDAQATGTITNDDAAAGPAVNVSSTTVAPGGTINFTVSGGPGNPMDWVSLSAVSAADSNFVDWKFLNGQKTAPASGLTSATLQFTAPATPGTYNIRFFANNSYTKLATSATITVAP